jgi:hypothetical protein
VRKVAVGSVGRGLLLCCVISAVPELAGAF